MNFWERKSKYDDALDALIGVTRSGQNPLPTESKVISKDDWHKEQPILSGECYFKDPSGKDIPIKILKGCTIEHKYAGSVFSEVVIYATETKKKLTYKERQKEIEIMMQSVTDGSYLVYDGFTTLYGKKLENYTQKELFDTLKKLMGE